MLHMNRRIKSEKPKPTMQTIVQTCTRELSAEKSKASAECVLRGLAHTWRRFNGLGSKTMSYFRTCLCVFVAIREKGLINMVKITDEYFYTADGKCYALYRVEVKEKLIQRSKQKSCEIG